MKPRKQIHDSASPIPTRRRQSLSVIAGVVLAAAMQTTSFAQLGDLNLINAYCNNGQTMTGAAAEGLPGDVWSVANSGSFPDAQGNSTPVTISISGGWGTYNQEVDESPITQNLLTGYYFGGTQNISITGLDPDTNVVLYTYMSGNSTLSGGQLVWSYTNSLGATNTLTLFATNNPLTTKANFTQGQNYVVMVGRSDDDGNINMAINGYTAPEVGPSCWNGVQIQEAPTIPVVYGLPTPEKVFAGQTAHFTSRSAGLPPLTNVWQLNGNTINNGGQVAGATSPVLAYGNASSSGTITLTAANASGSGTASTTLTVVTPAAGTYAAAVNSAPTPAVYWPLNEASGSKVAYDYINGYNATVGADATLGVAAAANPPYVGFPNPHTGATIAPNDPQSAITVPTLGFNGNSATFTAWVKPNGPQNPGEALLLTPGSGGILYGNNADQLAYTWGAFTWDSSLTVPENTWSFVALVVTPGNATLYLFNTGSDAAAINTAANASVNFTAATGIGCSPTDTSGTTNFNGSISDVAVFSSALSGSQVYALYAGAVGAGSAPIILQQPSSTTISAGATAEFSVAAVGTAPFTYKWALNGNPLSDTGRITGSTNSVLIIKSVGSGDVGNYTVTVTGAIAPAAVSQPASLTLSARPEQINLQVSSDGYGSYTGAAILGQAGDKWNYYPGGTQSLVDYGGNPSGVTFAITGNSGNYNNYSATAPYTYPLLVPYYYVSSGTMTMTLTGLNTNAVYTVVAYGVGNAVGQGALFGGALTGTNSGADWTVLTANDNYIENTNIITDGSGNLVFTVSNPVGLTYGAFNGLQIAAQNLAGALPVLDPVQPEDVTNYAGGSETFSVRAVNATSYQWLDGTTVLHDGGDISGSKTAVLTLNPLKLGDTGAYSCLVSNANGGLMSTTGYETVLDGTFALHWWPPVPLTTANAVLSTPGHLLVYAAAFGGQSNGVDYITIENGTTFDWTYNVNASVVDVNGGQLGTGLNFSGSGDPVFDTLMSEANVDGGPKIITLNNLTPGVSYAVQLFGLDDRGGTIGLREAYYTDPIAALDQSATFRMEDNVYVVGTFVASNATQNVVMQLPGNGSGGDVNAGNLQALVVWLTPPQVSLVINHNGTLTVNWNQNLTDTQSGVGPAHLQSASSLTGPWTDLGTSGSITAPISGGQLFYRAVLP